MPEVYWAIEKGQYGTLKRLIDSGVDVDMLDHAGDPLNIANTPVDYGFKNRWADCIPEARFSPLALAAFHGRNWMVELLLDKGANLELQSVELCACCNSPPLRCIEDLPSRPEPWENSGFDCNGRDDLWVESRCNSWWTPLHYAICGKNTSTAKLLIERGASTEDIGNCVPALHLATYRGSREVVDYLLDNDLVHIDDENADGATALHMAYVTCRYDLVDEYLDRGADINLEFRRNSGPWNILSMACADGNFDRALQYLRRGADPGFVVKHWDGSDAWTAMRFIYGSQSNKCPDLLEDDDVRITLEREIIARGREETAPDA